MHNAMNLCVNTCTYRKLHAKQEFSEAENSSVNSTITKYWNSGAMGNSKSNVQDQTLHSSKTPKCSKEAPRFIGREAKTVTSFSSNWVLGSVIQNKNFQDSSC